MNNLLNFGPNNINDSEKKLNNIARKNNTPFSLMSNSQKLGELYSKAVGEIGIAPSEFYNMTEEELDAAYEGYLRRKELEANLITLAILKGLGGSDELITLVEEKEYEIGSEEEREQTFLALGISIDEV